MVEMSPAAPPPFRSPPRALPWGACLLASRSHEGVGLWLSTLPSAAASPFRRGHGGCGGPPTLCKDWGCRSTTLFKGSQRCADPLLWSHLGHTLNTGVAYGPQFILMDIKVDKIMGEHLDVVPMP